MITYPIKLAIQIYLQCNGYTNLLITHWHLSFYGSR